MKEPRDYKDDSMDGRRFIQGVIIALIASAAIWWAGSELFQSVITAIESAP